MNHVQRAVDNEIKRATIFAHQELQEEVAKSRFATAEELANEIALAEKRAKEREESLTFNNAEPPCCSLRPKDYCPKGSEFEPISISFSELAAKNKAKDWNSLPLETQVDLIRNELKVKQFLLDPNSMFMKRWDIMMLLCLLYVSIVTPYQAVFVQDKMDIAGMAESPMFWINVAVDSFFFLDMIFNFYLKVTIDDKRGKRTLHTRSEIAKNYLSGWFWIDFVSILPIDILSTILLPQADDFTKDLKSIKLIRLFRLLKLLRVVRSSRIIARWESHSGISYKNRQLFTMLVALLFVSHMMACAWGLIGHFFLVMDCSSGYPVTTWSSEGTALPDGSHLQRNS